MASRRPSTFDIYGVPALTIAACVMTIGAIVTAFRSPLQYLDFYSSFYDSAIAYLHHQDIYLDHPSSSLIHPNLNPPAVVCLMAPLGWLSPYAALVAWWCVSGALVVTLSRMIAFSIELPKRWTVIAAVVLASSAGSYTILTGEISWAIAMLVTLAWIADRDDRPLAAGAWLGAAVYAKLFMLVFIPYLVYRRSWRMLTVALGSMTLLTLLGLLGAGLRAYQSWISALASVDTAWQANILNVSGVGWLSRILAPARATEPLMLAPSLVRPLSITWAALLSSIVAVRLRKTTDRDQAWAALILAGLLMAPLGWVYYLSLAIGPITVVFLRQSLIGRWLMVTAGLLLSVPYWYWAFSSLRFTPLQTATIASSFWWGSLALLASVLGPTLGPAPVSAVDVRWSSG